MQLGGRANLACVKLRVATEQRRNAPLSTASPALAAPLILALSSLLAFAWILHTQLQRLYGLTAPSWDTAQEQQLVWSLASGNGWASSYEQGTNFLGIHLEPALLVVAAAERLWMNPAVPLIFAAAGLAATAPAAFLMLRALLPDRPGSTWLALALAAPMPFWAATQEAASDQFHPETMALALAMLALWAGLRQRHALLWIFVVLVLSIKEDQTYIAFLIGFVVWRIGSPAMKAHGRSVMILAVAWLLIGAGVVEVLIRRGGYSPDFAYYAWMVDPGRPNILARSLLRPDAWLAIAGLLVSLLGLPLLAPRWLLLAVPPLIANLLSSNDVMEKLQLHYVMLIMFPLVLAAGFGARRFMAERTIPAWLPGPALLAAALPALVIGFAGGRLPPALGADQWLYNQPSAAERLLAATRVIPPGAPVYADDGTDVWLSNRTRIAQIPEPILPDRYVVVDLQDWTLRYDPSEAGRHAAARLLATGRHLLVDDGRFQVWSPAD
jgi:uncharacterized membrane protein